MKISVQKVQAFENSGLIEHYESVTKAALVSDDERRIKAAEQVQESASNLRVFLSCCKMWKKKRGYYIVPQKHHNIANKVRIYINKDGLFSRIRARWQRK